MNHKQVLLMTVLPLLILGACGRNQGGNDVSETEDPIPDSVKVSYEHALKLVNNYAPRAGFVPEGNPQKPDSRSIWFSVSRLKMLIKQIEDEGGDGIRFYFATYDTTYLKNERGPHVPPPKYWGYNTLLLVSTKDSIAANMHYHRDYYTNAIEDDGGRVGKGFMVMADIENDGDICPPPSKCRTVGALLVEDTPKTKEGK